MTLKDYQRLNKHTDNISTVFLNSQISTNLKAYLDWGLLNIGAFTNVNIPRSGAFGGDFSRLRPVKDPAYLDGQIWETARKDWVYETGLDFTVQPNQITGVVINGTGFTTGDLSFGHHYNYPLGRVVFNSPIPQNFNVQMSYAFRGIQTYISTDSPWWEKIQYNSLRVDDSNFLNTDSGNWALLSNHRVQMPAVVIEPVPRRAFTNYEMGTVGHFVYQDVALNILSQTAYQRDQLVDIISLEKDRTIWLYDNNKILSGDLSPLDYKGSVVSNPIMYPDFVDNYRYKRARFYNMGVSETERISSRLYTAEVRATLEIVMA
jgi:hypothetical protein